MDSTGTIAQSTGVSDHRSARAAYRELVSAAPALFENATEGGIDILLDDAEIDQAEETVARRLAAKGQPVEWARVGIAFQDQYTLLLRDAVRFPDGSLGTYIRQIPPRQSAPGVVVLAVWREQILLLRHFRHATRSWQLEVPRGFGEPGLSDDENGRRELAEEIGATATRFEPLGSLRPDTGMAADRIELFYAEVESFARGHGHEGIADVLPTPVTEVERLIGNGMISDGFTLAAFLRARLRNLI